MGWRRWALARATAPVEPKGHLPAAMQGERSLFLHFGVFSSAFVISPVFPFSPVPTIVSFRTVCLSESFLQSVW